MWINKLPYLTLPTQSTFLWLDTTQSKFLKYFRCSRFSKQGCKICQIYLVWYQRYMVNSWMTVPSSWNYMDCRLVAWHLERCWGLQEMKKQKPTRGTAVHLSIWRGQTTWLAKLLQCDELNWGHPTFQPITRIVQNKLFWVRFVSRPIKLAVCLTEWEHAKALFCKLFMSIAESQVNIYQKAAVNFEEYTDSM